MNGLDFARRAGSVRQWLATLALLGLACQPQSTSAQTREENPVAPAAFEPRIPRLLARREGLDALPSTVSPSIARFARASGTDEAVAAIAARPNLSSIRPAGAIVSSTDLADQPPPLALIEPRALPRTESNPLTQSRGQGAPGRSDQARGVATSNPLFRMPKLPEAPFAPGDQRFPINLSAALRLSDARPLIVAAAQVSVWIAEADLTTAKVLWIPSANLAADYIRHDGGGPDFNKGILTSPSVNYLYAGGSFLQSVNLSDAFFAPLQARQRLNARHFDVQSAKNDALLQTANAYFGVHQARGEYSGHLYTIGRGQELVRVIQSLSEDLVTRVEIDRARNLVADLEQRAALSRRNWRVESANLTQVLRLDPRAVVEPLEHDHTQITLVDPGRTLDDLMPVALANRPELGARTASVREAEYSVRRERNRPLLPLFQLSGFQSAANGQIQGGIFGIGPNSSLNQYRGREDVSATLVWQLEGLGFGNLARIKGARGQQSQSIVNLRNQQDAVAADVNRALARVQSASVRILKADHAVRSGIITFNGQVEGLGQTKRFGDVLTLVFRPQETIYSLDLLNIAFVEYFDTVGEYNRAQFDLFHALGYPARELAEFRNPGGATPVDTQRPGYLPAVGNGPPRASR